jgi:hypothetical protein
VAGESSLRKVERNQPRNRYHRRHGKSRSDDQPQTIPGGMMSVL